MDVVKLLLLLLGIPTLSCSIGKAIDTLIDTGTVKFSVNTAISRKFFSGKRLLFFWHLQMQGIYGTRYMYTCILPHGMVEAVVDAFDSKACCEEYIPVISSGWKAFVLSQRCRLRPRPLWVPRMPAQRCCCCSSSLQYKSSRKASPADKEKARQLGLLKVPDAIKICTGCQSRVCKRALASQEISSQPAAADQADVENTPKACHQDQSASIASFQPDIPTSPKKRSALSSRVNWTLLNSAEEKEQAETAKRELKAEKRKYGEAMLQIANLKLDNHLMKEAEQQHAAEIASLVIKNREQAEELADVSIHVAHPSPLTDLLPCAGGIEVQRCSQVKFVSQVMEEAGLDGVVKNMASRHIWPPRA